VEGAAASGVTRAATLGKYLLHFVAITPIIYGQMKLCQWVDSKIAKSPKEGDVALVALPYGIRQASVPLVPSNPGASPPQPSAFFEQGVWPQGVPVKGSALQVQLCAFATDAVSLSGKLKVEFVLTGSQGTLLSLPLERREDVILTLSSGGRSTQRRAATGELPTYGQIDEANWFRKCSFTFDVGSFRLAAPDAALTTSALNAIDDPNLDAHPLQGSELSPKGAFAAKLEGLSFPEKGSRMACLETPPETSLAAVAYFSGEHLVTTLTRPVMLASLLSTTSPTGGAACEFVSSPGIFLNEGQWQIYAGNILMDSAVPEVWLNSRQEDAWEKHPLAAGTLTLDALGLFFTRLGLPMEHLHRVAISSLDGSDIVARSADPSFTNLASPASFLTPAAPDAAKGEEAKRDARRPGSTRLSLRVSSGSAA
jgi:hypothetical protein